MIILRKPTGRVQNLWYMSPLPGVDKEGYLSPVVPNNKWTKGKFINHTLPRTLLYTSIPDALSGGLFLEQNLTGKHLWVYKVCGVRSESLIQPSLTDAPWRLHLDEWWYLADLRLEAITEIEVTKSVGEPLEYHYGPRGTKGTLRRWEYQEVLKPWEKPKLK